MWAGFFFPADDDDEAADEDSSSACVRGILKTHTWSVKSMALNINTFSIFQINI